ncbi:MAG: hypothetical protein ACW986_19555 [Promethearchaeota archaeon]|jgi:hypothetical protein
MEPYSTDKGKRRRKFKRQNSKVENYSNFMIFEVEVPRKVTQLYITEEEFRRNDWKYLLDSKRVLLIVKKELLKIYIWNGVRSTSSHRYSATLYAEVLKNKLSSSEFRRYKIATVDTEQTEFLKSFGLEPKDAFDRLILKVESYKAFKTYTEAYKSSKPELHKVPRYKKPMAKNYKALKIEKDVGLNESVTSFLNRLKWYDLQCIEAEQPPESNNKAEQEEKKKIDDALKIIVFGVPEKTTFIRKFLTGEYRDDLRMTIGADFSNKKIEVDGKAVTLRIWDFAAEKRFRRLLPNFVCGADGGILMYDVVDTKILKEITEVIDIIRKNAGTIPIFLTVSEVPSKEGQFADFNVKYTLTELTSEVGPKGEDAIVLLTKKILEHKHL